MELLKQKPGFEQEKLYVALPLTDCDCLNSFVESSLLIRKVKADLTNALYLQ